MNRTVSLCVAWHDRFAKLACYLQSPFLLCIRVALGWQFAITGWGKLHNLSQVTGFFEGLHLPFPAFTAVFVANVEFIGGILLILGLLSRVTGLVLSINMVVAYITASWDDLVSWDFDKFTKADPFLFLAVPLIVLIFGAGVFSVDWVIGRKFLPKVS